MVVVSAPDSHGGVSIDGSRHVEDSGVVVILPPVPRPEDIFVPDLEDHRISYYLLSVDIQ